MPHITPTTKRYVRRARLSFTFGISLTAVSFTVLIGTLALKYGEIDWWRVVGSLAMLGMIIGVVFGGVSLLAMKGRSLEEAYTLGFDLGFERGLRSARHPDGDDPESVSAALDEVAEVPKPRGRHLIHPKATGGA